MEKFLSRRKSGPRQRGTPTRGRRALDTSKMAADAELPGPTDSSDEETAAPGEHTKIANEVAKLLRPAIQDAVNKAVSKGIQSLRHDLLAQSQRVTELEDRVSRLEDDSEKLKQSAEDDYQKQKVLMDRIEDLENRSRRNNLRIVGLPESYRPSQLAVLCSHAIPDSLGISDLCKVERAHRIGPPNGDRKTPRPVIAKYLDYNDRQGILQAYRARRELMVDGHSLLLFADYSIEVSKKRKAFQKACASLSQKKIRFTLAYPEVLRFQTEDGAQHAYKDPVEALTALQSLDSQQPNRADESVAVERTTPLKRPHLRPQPLPTTPRREIT